MSRIPGLALILSLALIGPAAVASAQPSPDGWEEARFGRGPLRFTPGFELLDAGIDTNVFNEADEPKEDVVATLRPSVDYWLRLGAVRLSATSSVDYHYFRDFDSQRTLGTGQEVRLDVPLSRFTPFAIGTYTNRRERLGFEIDARARQRAHTLGGGLATRVQGRTTVILSGQRSVTDYAEDARFLGFSLSEELDRDTTVYSAQLEYELTPLTTALLDVQRTRDQFEFSPARDADSWSVRSGFRFDPFALIGGSVLVGVRSFDALDPSLNDFTGLVASGDLTYDLQRTSVNLRVERDVAFSYLPSDPYFVQTGFETSTTQLITESWDVVLRIGRQTLDYQSTAPSAQAGLVAPPDSPDSPDSPDGLDRVDERIERVNHYGAGTGYRFGETLRIGFEVDYYERQSDVDTFRGYRGWRGGVSIVYQ